MSVFIKTYLLHLRPFHFFLRSLLPEQHERLLFSYPKAAKAIQGSPLRGGWGWCQETLDTRKECIWRLFVCLLLLYIVFYTLEFTGRQQYVKRTSAVDDCVSARQPKPEHTSPCKLHTGWLVWKTSWISNPGPSCLKMTVLSIFNHHAAPSQRHTPRYGDRAS